MAPCAVCGQGGLTLASAHDRHVSGDLAAVHLRVGMDVHTQLEQVGQLMAHLLDCVDRRDQPVLVVVLRGLVPVEAADLSNLLEVLGQVSGAPPVQLVGLGTGVRVVLLEPVLEFLDAGLVVLVRGLRVLEGAVGAHPFLRRGLHAGGVLAGPLAGGHALPVPVVDGLDDRRVNGLGLGVLAQADVHTVVTGILGGGPLVRDSDCANRLASAGLGQLQRLLGGDLLPVFDLVVALGQELLGVLDLAVDALPCGGAVTADVDASVQVSSDMEEGDLAPGDDVVPDEPEGAEGVVAPPCLSLPGPGGVPG